MFKKINISTNVELYRSGSPFETKAVVQKINASMSDAVNNVPFFDIYKVDGDIQCISKLESQDVILGLGQNMGGINKRGKCYVSYATDDFRHTPEKSSLYGVHPFFIVAGPDESWGVFVDYPSRIEFDMGFSKMDELTISIGSIDFDLYLFRGSPISIIAAYRELTGQSFLPPRWAFGYQQSRWSYPDSKKIREIAASFKKNNIPCDAIYLDLDYMDDFKVFTVSDERFKDIKSLIYDLKQEGIRLIPIIDPGVKVEKGYSVYEEGIKKGFFCTTENGAPFVGGVWPGQVHLPDFFNEKTADWWGALYGKLLELGIEGFWNDMNEPALIFTPRSLDNAFKVTDEVRAQENPSLEAVFKLIDAYNSVPNNEIDFKSFYHETKAGRINHHQLHNLYGFYMTRAAARGLEKLQPGKRYYLLTRSSYAGAHRDSGVWTGDNCSWWEHILLNVKMCLSLNMCGFLYCGADTGGFGSDASADLMIRWIQAALFMPLLRNHAALGTRDQEPWAFDDTSRDIMGDVIRLRYSLIPYIYSEFLKARENNRPFLSPLLFTFNDSRSRTVEDQYLAGESVMAAPLFQPNQQGRYVYLPEGDWLFWKAASFEKQEYQVLSAGDHYVAVGLHETPLFLREDHLLVQVKPAAHVEALKMDNLLITGLIKEQACFSYYEDDGLSVGENAYSVLEITVTKSADVYDISVEKKGPDSAQSRVKHLSFELFDNQGNSVKKQLSL